MSVNLSMAIMLLIFLLQLINSFGGLSGAEHETLCTSNACFTLHMEKVSFEKAQQNCGDNGGYLMTLRNRHEEDVLRSLLSLLQRQHQGTLLKVWIGLKLHRQDCVFADKTLRGFKWVSGEEDSNYSNWKRQPASTCTEERCVKVDYIFSGQNQLKWIAGSCKMPAFFACKFYFKGMCKPLALLGPGQITYTPPFSKEPQRSEMKSFPIGTYAIIQCSNQLSHYSVCKGVEDTYSWNDPGPFCRAGKRNCGIINGGCEHPRCEHNCLNSIGSFSCYCNEGFVLSKNGHSCVDINECVSARCLAETDGFTYTPHVTVTSATSLDDSADEETQENFTESLTRTTVELQHQSPHTDAPLPHLVNVTHGDEQSNASLATSSAKTVNSRVIVCVLGSVIPLLMLVTMTLFIHKNSIKWKYARKYLSNVLKPQNLIVLCLHHGDVFYGVYASDCYKNNVCCVKVKSSYLNKTK
uniref:Complement component C1q receptor-like n=1 Tax=Acanthochromis polyacanthus TaxID=80966 RepID=A0A3Q1FEV3_9TELE